MPELTILIEIGSPKSKLVFSVTIDNDVPSTYTNWSSTPYSYKIIPKIGPETTPRTIAKSRPFGNNFYSFFGVLVRQFFG